MTTLKELKELDALSRLYGAALFAARDRADYDAANECNRIISRALDARQDLIRVIELAERALECSEQYDNSVCLGVDAGKNKRALYRGVKSTRKKALSEIKKLKGEK